MISYNREFGAVRNKEGGHKLCKLRDHTDNAVAKERERRARLQCLRSLLQVAQSQSPSQSKEGLHPNSQP
jgi:hypothetical protein